MRIEPRFVDLTPKQKRKICNGCGPMGWGWLVPEFCFHEAGNRHDFGYWMGGGWTDKLRADLRFLADCLLASLRQPKKRFPWLAGLSFIYFFAVLFGGRRAFTWGKRKDVSDLAALEVL